MREIVIKKCQVEIIKTSDITVDSVKASAVITRAKTRQDKVIRARKQTKRSPATYIGYTCGINLNTLSPAVVVGVML